MSSTTFDLSAVKEEIGPESLLACRICLASDVKLYNIREWGLDQVFVDLMGTTLSAWDGFPQHVCFICRALLDKCNELRECCRRAEQLLKQSLMHQHFITTSFIQSIDREAHRLTHPYSRAGSNRDVQHIKHEDKQTNHNDTYVFLVENNIDNDEKDIDLRTPLADDDDDHFKMDADSDRVDTDLDTDGARHQNSLEANVAKSDEKKIATEVQTSKRKKVGRNEEDKTSVVVLSSKRKREHDKGTVEGETQSAKRKKVKNEGELKGALNSKRKKVVNEETVKGDVLDTQKKKVVSDAAEKTKRKSKKRGQSWRLKPFCTEEDFKEFEKKYNFAVIALSEDDMVKEMEARRESDNYKYGVFKCEMCLKGFLSSSTYNNHLKTHDMTRKHECRLCHVRYHFPALLRGHMQRSHELKFLCLKCNEIMKNKACAELHAAFHAGATFKCDHCDMTFLKKTSRSTHMRMEHPREIADGGTCELCGETFTGALGLKAHKTRSHKTLPTLPKLRCRTCKVQFETMEAIERHRSDQARGKCDATLSACARCGAMCASEKELLAHRMELHGLQLFSCDTCGKSFETKESVGTHIDRVHLRIRPKAPPRPGFRHRPRARDRRAAAYRPVCEHCGKRASCMATLKLHMTQHTGERPYKCTLCPKTYRTPVGLNSHEAFHTGARKYRCQECPAAFMHQSSLYQHRRAIHSGEKAYQCKICEKTFTQSGSLHTHVKYVHMKVKPPPRKRNKKTAT